MYLAGSDQEKERLPARSDSGHGPCQRGRADSAVRWPQEPALNPSLRRSGPSARAVHSFQRLLHNPCCGLPPLDDGSLDQRRHRGRLLVVVVLCFRQQQRGAHLFQRGQRKPGERVVPFHRFLRALRPSICREAAFAPNLTTGTAPASKTCIQSDRPPKNGAPENARPSPTRPLHKKTARRIPPREQKRKS